MLKYLFIILNSLAIFLYSMLRDDLDIITGFPNKVNAGETFNAEVTIFKGSLRKFGKLELIFPTGFTVESTDPKAADFTFIGNKATFLWSYLPAEEEFTVSFKVTASASVSGKKIIKSNFYYVENNLKEVLEIDPIEIKVKNDVTPPQDDEVPITKKKPADTSSSGSSSTIPVVNTDSNSQNTNKTAIINTTNNENTTATVTANREVLAGTAAGEIIVRHTIDKGNLTGFGKIEDAIPDGYAVSNDKGAGASYSFNNNKVRYVWVNMPSDPKLEVSYILKKTGSPSFNTINGTFDYLSNNETKSVTISESTIPSTDSQVAQQTTNTSKSVEPIVKKEKAKPTEGALTGYKPNAKKTPPKRDAPATLNTQTIESKPTETIAKTDTGGFGEAANNAKPLNTELPEAAENKSTSSGNSSSNKVNYSIQVAALQKAKEAKAIQKFLALNMPLQIELHEGYNKYMAGKFDEYLNAKNQRDKIRDKGKRRAFVTAYNTGKRITVQEALMISKQQWYK
jgi:hypothetical protein